MNDLDNACRDRALDVLLDLAENRDLESAERGQAAEVILIDIREHRGIADEVGQQRDEMNEQIARMESAYLDLREAMDALPKAS